MPAFCPGCNTALTASEVAQEACPVCGAGLEELHKGAERPAADRGSRLRSSSRSSALAGRGARLAAVLLDGLISAVFTTPVL